MRAVSKPCLRSSLLCWDSPHVETSFILRQDTVALTSVGKVIRQPPEALGPSMLEPLIYLRTLSCLLFAVGS